MFKELIQKAQKHYGVIYLVRNTMNNKIYVGQTTNLKRRIKEYRVSKIYKKSQKYTLMKEIVKHGYENFTYTILDVAETKEELNGKEIFWIKCLNASNPSVGYNKKTGGDGGSMNNESIQRMRNSSRKFRHTEETKIKKSIPIITFKNGDIEYFHGAKAFADFIKTDRSVISSVIRNGRKFKGYFIFYSDNSKREDVLNNLILKNKVREGYIDAFNYIKMM